MAVGVVAELLVILAAFFGWVAFLRRRSQSFCAAIKAEREGKYKYFKTIKGTGIKVNENDRNKKIPFP